MISYSTLFGIFVLLVGLAELGLLFYFLRYEKSITIKAYLWFIAGTVIWVLANAISQLQGPGDISFIQKFGYLGGTILTSSFLFFIHAFPHPQSRNIFWLQHLPWISTVIFGSLLFFTNSFYEKLFLEGFGFSYSVKQGWGLWAWTIFFLLTWILAVIELIKRFRKSGGVERKRFRYLLIGVLFSLFTGLISDVFMPLFSNGGILALGSAGSIVWFLFTVKAVRV